MKMDYEKEYKEALSKAREFYNNEQTRVGMTPIDLESIFPELKQGVERIRKAISQCVEDMRGQFEKLYGVHHKDAIAWIEKQSESAKLTEEEQNRFAKSVLSSCALSFINYLDAHKYEGKMCVSNGECEDIENAFHNAMWDRLHRYYCKYIEKPTNIKNTKAKDFSENRDDLSEFFKQVCHMAASLVNKEHDYTMETIEWYAYRLLECAKKELEKQGEQKPTDKVEPKFKVGDWIIRCAEGFKHNTYRVIEVNDYYVCEALNARQVTFTFNDVHQNFRLWNISDAKDGDVLAEDTCIFIIKKLYNDITAKIYCCLFDDGDFDLTGSTLGFDEDSTYPATKEQRDLLLKEMYMRGYIFDFEKKELKELKKIEKNPVDKVEPKFKVGDWITNGDYTWKIVEVKPLDYILQSQDGNIVDDTISHVDEQFHSFTIEDAKDGDVLCYEDEMFIIKNYVLFHKIVYHCCYDGKNFIPHSIYSLTKDDFNNVHPAIKEQRDLLFAKMYEAGYEWDAEKKELTKIEPKLAWSEEDKRKLNRIYSILSEAADTHAFNTSCKLIGDKECVELQDFLKSIALQNTESRVISR